MKVNNINGTSQNECSCGSWLRHWEIFSNLHANYCGESSCIEKSDLVGAHVLKDNSADKKWYILPLCKKHNASNEALEIYNASALVSANKKETCEK